MEINLIKQKLICELLSDVVCFFFGSCRRDLRKIRFYGRARVDLAVIRDHIPKKSQQKKKAKRIGDKSVNGV